MPRFVHAIERRLPYEPVVLVGTGLVVAFAILVVLGKVDFLAYHSVTEFLVAAVSLAVFLISWHTRALVDDDYLTVLGIAQLFVAIVTTLHTLGYNGMGVFTPANARAGLGSQFWLVLRTLQAAGLVAAAAYIGRTLRHPSLVFASFGIPTAIALLAVFARWFPSTNIAGRGLTPFKIYSDYVIIAGLALGLVLLWQKRDRLSPRVLADLAVAIALMIVAELMFTVYDSPYDVVSVGGHVVHLASMYFMYRALVARALEDPYSVLFRRLALREEERLRAACYSEALNRVGGVIHSTLDFDEIMESVVAEAGNALQLDAAAVEVREGEGWVVRYGYGLPKDQIGRPLVSSQRLAREVAVSRAVFVTRDLQKAGWEDAPVDVHAVMALPLLVKGEALGVLTFLDQHRARDFTSAELNFGKRLATSVSLALENARLYHSQRMVADRLQAALLALPERVCGIEFAHSYHSATEAARVGGDFYDVFELGQGRVGITIGDVAGKGLDAAVLTSLVKNTIRAHAMEPGKSPGRIVSITNSVVFAATSTDVFVTLFYGVLDTTDGWLAYANAGHTVGALRRGDGTTSRLPVTGPIVGAFEDALFGQAEAQLDPGDVLVLYSDGVSEARRDGRLYGEERLFGLVAASADPTPRLIVEDVVEDVVAYSRAELRDDFAILALRLTGAGAAGPQQQRLRV